MTNTVSAVLAAVCLQADATIRCAMEKINEGGFEIALVVEGDQPRLVGTVTDGDIRRALLGGARFEDPVIGYVNRRCLTVHPGAGRAEVLDLMRARSLSQVPILDDDSRLVGLHLLREMVGCAERPNWVVIMAGGRGERLRPLTDAIPKPMIKVAGRPILERLVLHCVSSGIRKIFLAVNYMSRMVQEHFDDGSRFGCQIHYLVEQQPLGTAGALALLPELPAHPLLVTNGDLITEFDAGQMLLAHDRESSVLTVGIREYRHTVPFGVLELDGARVTSIREKPSMACVVNAGVYVMEPELISRIPSNREFTMPELIDDCLLRNQRVTAYSIQGDWIDVGRPADLQTARGIV